MKLTLNLIILNLLLLPYSLQLSAKQSDYSLTSASSSANSVSVGNDYTQTKIYSKATATHGNFAEAGSAAAANTKNLQNEITVLAEAAGTNNRLVEHEISKEKTSTYENNFNAETGLKSDLTITDQLETNTKKTITLSDEEINENKYIAQNNQDKNLRNEIQNINDKSYDMSSIESFSKNEGSTNYLSQSHTREIVITIDAGSEKLIIEKIIGNDNRVIIVSAAKYLKKSIPQDVKDYFQQLYNQRCNCKLIKEYAVDLLAEGE